MVHQGLWYILVAVITGGISIVFTAIVSVALIVVSVATLALLARRTLGVPVGWLRAIVVGIGVVGFGAPTLNFVGDRLHLIDSANGSRLFDPAAATLLAVLTVAWIFLFGLLAVVVLEALAPSGSLPGPMTLIFGWKARRRKARRYGQIMTILVRHGLARFLRLGARGTDADQRRTARSLRHALEEGGVTFVKLGQTLSTRSELLPRVYIEELSRLQSDAQAETFEALEPTLLDGLDRHIDEVFAHVEHEPLAAASVGQVHAATLIDGTEVVVKIQRPTARRQIDIDLDILAGLSARLHRVAPWARAIGTSSLVSGFAASLQEELDYDVELDNALAIGATLAPSSPYTIPKMYAELSSPMVLVMERIDGVPLTRARATLESMTDQHRSELAADLLEQMLRQMIVSGVFHADLHGGNVMMRADGTVVLLDFGSVGRLDDVSRMSLGLFLHAVDSEDSLIAADALIELLGRPDGLDERTLERSLGELMVRYRGSTGGSRKNTGLFNDLISLVIRQKFTIPPQVAAAFRALATVEGTLTLLAPDLDLVSVARERGRSVMVGRLFDRTFIKSAIESQVAANLPLLRRMPRKIGKIVDQVEEGRFTVGVRLFEDRSDRQFVTKLAQEFMLSVLAGTGSIGSILLLLSTDGPQLTSTVPLYPVLGTALMFVSFILGLRVVVRSFFDSGQQ